MMIMIAAALLAAPSETAKADQDAVCALGLIDTAAYAEGKPGLSPEFRTHLTESAEFFSGVLTGRYEDVELGGVLAAAVVELVADRKRQVLVVGCFGRHDQARRRLQAANAQARETVLKSDKNSNQPR